MAARITELRDAVATLLQAGWVGTPATVHTAIPTVDADSLSGRHVWLYRAGQSDGGPASRTASFTDYRIAVQVNEKYDDPGDPTDAWVDDLVEWVETQVWDKLGEFDADTAFVDSSAWVLGREWEATFDPDLLTESRVFEAVVVLTLREAA